MSAHLLRVIPTDPSWVPGEDAAVRARRVLAELIPDARAVTERRYDEITFIDQGRAFEEVRCPVCGRILEISWWHDRMDEAYQSAFTELTARTPCCGSTVSLNELDYRDPAGFARFAVVADEWDVTRSELLSAQELARLGEALGHPVRQVHAVY